MPRSGPLPMLVALGILVLLGASGFRGSPAAGLHTFHGISTESGPVLVGISVEPVRGTLPLTVELRGVASGGTGDYVEYLWKLGDGDSGVGRTLNYTYLSSGEFVVTLNVTDSAGDVGTASTGVDVSAAPTTPSSAAPSWLFAVVLGAGVVAAGATSGASYWRGSREEADVLPLRVPPLGPVVPEPRSPLAPAQVPGEEARRPEPTGPAQVTAVGSAVEARGEPSFEGPTTTVQLSHLIIAHLARLPAISPNDLGTVDRTQAGMAQRFSASQSAVSNVIARLSAAGVVTGESRHVRGAARRLKVYWLTPLGENLARDLRGRQ